MSAGIELDYDKTAKRAVITFPNGRKLTLSQISEEQAKSFVTRHASEFQRRDCILHTDGAIETRSGGNG
jgi:hypothetical protein